ncbi:hypothetical protein PSQ20_12370 [Curvibacter sp. RS43]|jgi:hypothetical protein|uniref:hypothetical protein n=1 Tax=Curvibacter microcysteis TaxID=3026419 RepID=UPI002361E6FB|nr:hypothetical protein [Curvibacter sp. RS43]MDD0811141.1 hypothetical protein [Curvibacter sp. RS43]
MFAILARLFMTRPLAEGRFGRPQGGIANRLLEGAEARVGYDPQQAHELRQAAAAYLRVVR